MNKSRSSPPVGCIRAIFSRWRADKGGNAAVIFAITLLPILGLIGAAVDYTRANSARAALQVALDTTALMISRDAASLPADQVQARAQQYFNALYTRAADAPVSSFTASYTANSGSGASVTLTAASNIQTDFMKVMGSQFNSINLNGLSSTKWGSTKLRIALVLDNTGSMNDNGKITALRTAATNLVNQLGASATNAGDVMMSLVPFAKDVNVGTSNAQQPWIKWSGQSDTWDENNGTCSNSNYSTKSSCVVQSACSIAGNNTQGACASAGVCSNPGYTSQVSCTNAGTCSIPQQTLSLFCVLFFGKWTPYTWTKATWGPAVWTPASHNTWNGCVTDRDQDYDINSTAPDTANPATLFPAEQYSACPIAIVPLSYDWTALKNAIASMQPNGGTNQAIGLAWGWLSLIQGNPLNAPPEDPNYQWKHVIILLSDGLNTQDRWPDYGNGSTQYNCSPGNVRCVDARQQKLCDNIKAVKDSKGASLYTIYTIQVNTGSDPTSSILQYCASDSNKFVMLTDANQIISTFDSIGVQLSKLRITQ